MLEVWICLLFFQPVLYLLDGSLPLLGCIVACALEYMSAIFLCGITSRAFTRPGGEGEDRPFKKETKAVCVKPFFRVFG